MTLDIFFDRYLITIHAIVVAIGLVLYVTAARALPQRRDPSAAIAWVVALTLLPYVALPLYFMFGSRKLRMRDAPRSRSPASKAPPTTPTAPRSGPAGSAARWASPRRCPTRGCASTPTAPRRAPRCSS
jgi:cardiolipin synthase